MRENKNESFMLKMHHHSVKAEVMLRMHSNLISINYHLGPTIMVRNLLDVYFPGIIGSTQRNIVQGKQNISIRMIRERSR